MEKTRRKWRRRGKGEVRQEGPSRDCIGEAFNFLNSGFSKALPKVRTFFTRKGAEEGFMVPKGSTPPLMFYDAGQVISFAYYQGMRLPFPPIGVRLNGDSGSFSLTGTSLSQKACSGEGLKGAPGRCAHHEQPSAYHLTIYHYANIVSFSKYC